MAVVALTSAAWCSPRDNTHNKPPQKATDSKLNVETPDSTSEPTADAPIELAQDPIAGAAGAPPIAGSAGAPQTPEGAPQSSKAKTAKPISKKDFRNRMQSRRSFNNKQLPEDIINGKVDVSKMIVRFDSSKIPAPQPEPQPQSEPETKPQPKVQNAKEVIAAKCARVSKINWKKMDEKLSKK